MITHTPTFETLANAPVKQSDVIVARQILDTYGYIDDTSMIYVGGKDLRNPAVYRPFLMEAKIDAAGQMLGQVTKKATIKLLGTSNAAVSAVPIPVPAAGDTFQIRLGLMNPATSTYEYISEGFYLVETVEENFDEGYTTITLYDHMWKAAKLGYAATVPSNALTYPISVTDFATYIAGLLNIGIDPNFSTLPNASYMIAEDLYTAQSGTTLQNAIMDIAGATATTARITDATLMFSPYTVSSDTLDSNTLKTLKIGDTYGPVTSVILGRTPANDNIALYAANATNNVVEAINTSTDVITITDSGMSTGNMVYFTSTGTLPAPLAANTPYFVYMVSGDDTFKLSDTYNHAIAGTNFVNLTTAGTGVISLVPLTTKEIQINNNEVLDDDRQTLLPNLYNKLAGIYWSDVKADCIGHGWYECGDVINFTQGTRTVRAFLSEVHLVLAGSVKENVISTIPTKATIDYQAAGGILKTLNNTEIKVNKQDQTITSIVEQQSTFEGTTTNNFSQIYQNLTDILFTVQASGGGNLILNSVGFATDQLTDAGSNSYAGLSFWTYNPSYNINTHGTVTSYTSSESSGAGGISGQVIEMNGSSVLLEQTITVAANTPMSFGIRIKKAISMGGGTITLYNDIDTFTIPISNSTSYVWDELKIENFVSRMAFLKVKVQASSVTHLQMTDMRLIYGTTLQAWVQSASEILATNVQFSKLGMKIYDNVHNTETRVTYNEFSTRRRSDGKILFSADDTGVITNDLSIKGSTNYVDSSDKIVIKQITIPSGNSRAGIAFIKVS